MRGSVLKNTKWIKGIFLKLGLVVYTGSDTKIQRNSEKGKPKLSQIILKTNKYILMICIMQLILCYVSAMISAQFSDNEVIKYVE